MKCILSSTATGDLKSKIINNQMSVLSLDIYVTPSEFAELIERYSGKDFEIEFKD